VAHQAVFRVLVYLCTRGGKSYVIALLACYLAVFKKYDLSPGEKGHVLIVAPSVRQAKIIKHYLSSFFTENPLLAGYLDRELNEDIYLTNNIVISTLASNFRTLRGFTAIAGICDEIAFMAYEGYRPDTEIIRALRSRLLSTNGPLCCVSSPYSRRGELWKTYKRHYGNDKSQILVWHGSSLEMNPTLSEEKIDQALSEDPEGGRADYLGEFRRDITGYISEAALEQCIIPNRHELSYLSENNYFGFVDPSGGSSDSMTMAIGHYDLVNKIRVLDLLREVKPPFSPDQVVKDFSDTLKQYKINSISGDKYAGLWPAERFSIHGIAYKANAMPKSDIYKTLLPLLMSQQVELLDNEKLINQILNLERRVGRGGRDSIDHPPGRNSHDDLANACAGCLTSLQEGSDFEIRTTRSKAVDYQYHYHGYD
jgi:hypothetical protein